MVAPPHNLKEIKGLATNVLVLNTTGHLWRSGGVHASTGKLRITECRSSPMCSLYFRIFCCLSVFVTLTEGEARLKIEVVQPRLYAVQGGSILLSVNYSLPSNSELLDITWQHRRDYKSRRIYYFPSTSPFLESYTWRAQDFENGSIQLNKLNFSDSGEYIITVAAQNGREKEEMIELIVEDAVNIYDAWQSPPCAILGSNASLICIAFSAKNTEMEWVDGKLEALHSNLSISSESLKLQAWIVATNDCQQYTCVVKNHVSSQKKTMKLNVSKAYTTDCKINEDVPEFPSFRSARFFILVGSLVCVINGVIVYVCWHKKMKRSDESMNSCNQKKRENPDGVDAEHLSMSTQSPAASRSEKQGEEVL
ncbi:uncharacterized protein LOC120534927 [Polypterus senegalus]|uniref:uncharacterized protein LOC120534927 n=1 Tax=Polypterus senegalus TaxID=55291 RepID=UPI0019641EE7|nr:uncharacterized protein LOC120534927 [Polypterus senegalus]